MASLPFVTTFAPIKHIKKKLIMDANYSTHKATPRWLRSVASLAVAALFSSAACAQDIPAKPVNLRAVQQDGYVTLTWDRLA